MRKMLKDDGNGKTNRPDGPVPALTLSRHRRARYLEALYSLFTKLVFLVGVATILLWLFVENPQSILVYWLYIVGYTGVMVFQVGFLRLSMCTC